MLSHNFAATKIVSMLERADALQHWLARFEARAESSPATRQVLQFAHEAIKRLTARLDSLLTDPLLPLMTATEQEDTIRFAQKPLQLLHNTISYVAPSDVSSVSAALAPPLRRFVRTAFGNVDLIIIAHPELMYVNWEMLGGPGKDSYLRTIAKDLDFDFPSSFPERLFLIALPAAEYDQVLVHCIFAHEISHRLWPDGTLKLSFSADGDFGCNDPSIALLALEIANNWSREIASDLLAMRFFGPAYIFAAIHFHTSFHSLDAVTTTHPPFRLRLYFMLQLLNASYSTRAFSIKTLRFVHLWCRIAKLEKVIVGPISEDDARRFSPDYFCRLLDKITQGKIFDEIPSVTARIFDDACPTLRYTEQRYKHDLRYLCPLIRAEIPPVEYKDRDGRQQAATLPGILNAGWECYLDSVAQFAKAGDSQHGAAREFNRFLLKALELNEIRIAWTEAERDLEH